MTLGQKLKKLRIKKGLTQKDLADQLHVTFQTVSKWESDINEPDIATLKELSKFYNCSFNYLLSEDENETVSSENHNVVPTQVDNKPTIVHQGELHVCARCGEDIKEEDLVSLDSSRRVRTGRTTRTVSCGQTYYHKHCLEELKKERKEADRVAKLNRASHGKKLSFGWSIPVGVVAFGIALAIFLCNTQYVHPGLGVLYSILIGYGMFAMLYCIISGSYIGEVFVWCAGLSIKFPGIIFSWDLGGLAFLIVMKILFAVCGFSIGVFALLLAIALSAVLGAVSFPFILIHNERNLYEDVL